VLRHDAYLGLVLGIKSLNIWSMHENRPNLTTHQEQFEAYASVANELTGELNLQRVFLSGAPSDELTITITHGATTFNYTDIFGFDDEQFTYDTLHSFGATLGGDRYLFLVNSTEEKMAVEISGLPTTFLLDDLFAGTTRQMHEPKLPWELDVLGVAALRFRPLSASSPVVASGALLLVPEPSTLGVAAIAASAGACQFRRRRPSLFHHSVRRSI
jgi:hypothetical protein